MKKDNKEVKKTNYGEDYNRESMYETAREALLNGEKVVIAGIEHETLPDVILTDGAIERLEANRAKSKAKYFREIGNEVNAKEQDAIAAKRAQVSNKILHEKFVDECKNEILQFIDKLILDGSLKDFSKSDLLNTLEKSVLKSRLSESSKEYLIELIKEYPEVLELYISGKIQEQGLNV